ncbi:MAG: hypothetical protein MRY63_12965 [Neomegalonema sp.]|nr:hypothetical protein [Neomegalonema sp.]
MRLIKLITALIALSTAVGGFMSFKYGTTSTCEAAGKAIRDEMPAILDDLAENDLRFRALKVGRAMFGTGDAIMRGVTSELAAKEIEGRNALECTYLVGRRELDRSGFRKEMGEQFSAELLRRLNL